MNLRSFFRLLNFDLDAHFEGIRHDLQTIREGVAHIQTQLHVTEKKIMGANEDQANALAQNVADLQNTVLSQTQAIQLEIAQLAAAVSNGTAGDVSAQLSSINDKITAVNTSLQQSITDLSTDDPAPPADGSDNGQGS